MGVAAGGWRWENRGLNSLSTLLLVAAHGPPGSWRAGFGRGRWSKGATLEDALWKAVRTFRASPLPQRV